MVLFDFTSMRSKVRVRPSSARSKTIQYAWVLSSAARNVPVPELAADVTR